MSVDMVVARSTRHGSHTYPTLKGCRSMFRMNIGPFYGLDSQYDYSIVYLKNTY